VPREVNDNVGDRKTWRPLKRDRREIKGKLNVEEREMEIVGKREECTQNDVERLWKGKK
jgi:hypothetical protein